MHVDTINEPLLEIRRNQQGMWQMLDHAPTEHLTTAIDLLSLSAQPVIHLDFAVRYRLEVCVSRGFISEYAVNSEFLQALSALDPSSASRRLDVLIDKETVLEDAMQLFKDQEFSYFAQKTRVPHHCAMIYKVHLTPTALKLNPPSIESSNRVLRKYSSLHDRFLRVQFLEEGESGRIAKDRHNNEDVWRRLLRALHRGIRIGDRTFEFLAFGNSQLREGSVTFFAPTRHVSCDDIRQWLGDFSHIRNVAKFGARIGQCFSTSREIHGIHMPAIRYIDDIERNGHCFTDGVGIISELVSQFIAGEMLFEVSGNASAFQFRMGGCKGVLAVWPSAYATKTEVLIRKSQQKFTATTNNLEILRCASASTATLNRQTIVILEHLGVPATAFMSLLERQIKGYEEAMTNTAAAVELLTTFVDENQTTLTLAELLKYEFKDQFVTNLLSLWRSWSLKLVKEKARIYIEKSAFVIGVVDETGTLRGHSTDTEGKPLKDKSKLPQIFLKLSGSKHHKAQIVRGLCIIGRNPSLHAGDIRVVQAVDNPKLRHLSDVVVFPSKGDKPLPSMLSGGDLDGDDYFVIWEPSLLPTRWNTPPMPEHTVTPRILDRNVTVDDLRDFVVQYMKNDCLPLIATAHLAFADFAGVNSRTCLRLAELHSKAVDYPKTGVPVEWIREQCQPRRWPHFMEKRNWYRSRKALGQLYDRVANEDTRFQPLCEDSFDKRILAKYDIKEETLAEVKSIKAQYDFAVRRILNNHHLATEFELYSGWAMSKPAVGSDYKRQEVLGHEFDALKERFRDICYEAAGGLSVELLNPFVAAMYKVTADEVKDTLREETEDAAGPAVEDLARERRPLVSFPWIFHWVLIGIAVGKDYKSPQFSLVAARRYLPMKVTEGNVSIKQVVKIEKNEPSTGKSASEGAEKEAAPEGAFGRFDGTSEAAIEADAGCTEKSVQGKEDIDESPSDAPSTKDSEGERIEAKESAADRLMKMMDSNSDYEE